MVIFFNRGILFISIKHLGFFNVKGLSLLPKPAANKIALNVFDINFYKKL